MTHEFETVDVFTTQRFGGNPLAVFPDARGIDPASMQRIAREFNLSETTFVLPATNPANTAQVRIFTPVHELPFAGHPNVGTALVLAARQAAAGIPRPGRMVFEQAAGLVEITFDWSTTPARATLAAPQALTLGEQIPAETIAACTGLAPGDILTTLHAPIVAGVGTPFVIAEVTPEALPRAAPGIAAIQAAAARHPVRPLGFPIHLHAKQHNPATHRRTRMFAPLSGLPEDPATGAANLALVALLLSVSGDANLDLVLEQGVEMGRPSTLYAAAWQAADGVRARIGGSAIPVLRGLLHA